MKFDKEPCGFWEDYYMDRVAWKDITLCEEIYNRVKTWAYKLDYPSLISLVEAIQQDKDSEGCCVGQEFSILVTNMLGHVDEPCDDFEEAAIRDVLEQYGLYPCYLDYARKKSTDCTICGPVIKQILEAQKKVKKAKEDRKIEEAKKEGKNINAREFIPRKEIFDSINFPVKYDQGLPIYHNPDSGQAIVFYDTARNTPYK